MEKYYASIRRDKMKLDIYYGIYDSLFRVQLNNYAESRKVHAKKNSHHKDRRDNKRYELLDVICATDEVIIGIESIIENLELSVEIKEEYLEVASVWQELNSTPEEIRELLDPIFFPRNEDSLQLIHDKELPRFFIF